MLDKLFKDEIKTITDINIIIELRTVIIDMRDIDEYTLSAKRARERERERKRGCN